MSGPDQTDAEVLAAIRRGDGEAWSALVNEYQGRLLRFAMARVPQQADAEDIVQNTFASLVKAVDTLQIKVSLETYLFGIVRNEIVQRIRTQQARSVCLIQDVYYKDGDNTSGDALAQVRSPDPSTSWCVSHNEEHRSIRDALTEAVRDFVKSLRKKKKLHRLKMAELLFYCQLSSVDIAKQLGVQAGSVRTFKHRCLKRIREDFARRCATADYSASYSEDLLTAIWEEQRLSCIKRSTLGAFLLESLSPEWFDYVDFHLSTMGCHFCRASYKDLQEEQQMSKRREYLRERILASTVGFLSKP
ncbi:MAG: sigma-70 family RNA polymerase sigma factor [Phycisphaerales bacterium]|nr:MAG: sigma-70 family RNA polymerase sigma factor [Phycisphaerales bacterium]